MCVTARAAGALTFIVVAYVLVAHLQVDVVLPALPFAALQPALRPQPCRHLLHVEAGKTKGATAKFSVSVFMT